MRTLVLSAVAAVWATSGLAAPAASPITAQFRSAERANLDAAARHSRVATQRLAAATQASRFGYASQVDEQLGTTFLWVKPGSQTSALKSSSLTGRALVEANARHHLAGQAQALGLTQRAIDEARVFEVHDRGEGPVITRLRQTVHGVEVFGRELSVLTDRQGRLVAVGGYFAPTDSHSLAAVASQLSAPQAIARAFADLGGKTSTEFTAGDQKGDYRVWKRPAQQGDLRLEADPRVKMVYHARGDQVVPAYYIELSAATRDAGRQADFAYVISATDGRVLFRKNQRAHDAAFTYRMLADSYGVPYDSPLGNGTQPFPKKSPDASVPRKPKNSRIVTLATSKKLSTQDPWLAEGATTTSGNNVKAYLDLASPDGYSARRGDLMPTTTAPQTFDYPLQGDTDPNTDGARKGAVVNLFYMNNWLHDFWYDHGFDEAAGNAQVSNFGRGGVEGDPILAEGQDYSGRNNANMSTPADGSSPRMQMYLFDGMIKGELSVVDPVSMAGALTFGTAGFGATSFDLTGTLQLVDDGTAPTSDNCTAPLNAGALAGRIALIDRGNCDFVTKVKLAQAAGAVGALVVNNVTGSPFTMGGTDASITIPAMMTTMEEGAALKASATPVTVHMKRDPAIDLDGTIDEGIIAHEFFHYVSNRLVGNASGLSNNQGGSMGEGWSDFSAMLLQVRADDTQAKTNADWEGGYSMGGYVLGDQYFGIRRAPYSTDFAKNPLTFKHIQNGVALPTTAPLAFGQDGASNAEVHNSGEVWANMLWEAYVGFLKDGRYTFKQARSKVQDYVIAGLKMTPNAPTMVEARDAILAVADATDDGDFMIWATAFAKRGMGQGAVAPSRYSTTHAGVVESYVVATPTP